MIVNEIVKVLNQKYPQRNWGYIMERYSSGEYIQIAQRMAIERVIEEVKQWN